MRDFKSLSFDPVACRSELEKFRILLRDHRELEERRQVLTFFRKHEHLSGLIGWLAANPGQVDHIAYEFSWFRDFTCDLALADKSNPPVVTLVEFEDARKASLFKARQGRNIPMWSERVGHGESQIIDWLWKIDDQRRTEDFRQTFGEGEVKFVLFLIVGRKHFLGTRELRRMQWRKEKLVFDSHKIEIFTYDELLDRLSRKLRSFEVMQSTTPTPADGE